MLDILYSYIFSPAKTVQTKSHIKNWRLWWMIIGITALISVIQVSDISLFSLAAHAISYVVFICIVSMIIDATAQLLGSKSKLRTLVYWFGFANTIFWLSPSIIMVQEVLSSFGALAMVCLNGLFLYVAWVTLQHIYHFSHVRVFYLFFIPIITVIISGIAVVIYSAHWITTFL